MQNHLCISSRIGKIPHPFPLGAVLGIVRILFLGKTIELLIQLRNSWDFLQLQPIKGILRRLVKRDLFPMGFKKIPAVASLPVCLIDSPRLAVVDDMCPQLPDLLHPCFFLFDVGKQMIRLCCRKDDEEASHSQPGQNQALRPFLYKQEPDIPADDKEHQRSDDIARKVGQKLKQKLNGSNNQKQRNCEDFELEEILHIWEAENRKDALWLIWKDRCRLLAEMHDRGRKVDRLDLLIRMAEKELKQVEKVAVATMATNPGRLWDYVHGGTGKGLPIQNKPLPIVTIATSSGTGSEVNEWGVICNDETHEKIGFGDSKLLKPVLAVVDPTYMTTVPPKYTAYQGFDAFFHNEEVMISKSLNVMSKALALSAIENIVKYLPRAVRNGNDPAARNSAVPDEIYRKSFSKVRRKIFDRFFEDYTEKA